MNNNEKKPAVLIDIHGTLLNNKEEPNQNLIYLLQCIAEDEKYDLLIFTAENINDQQKQQLEEQLIKLNIPFNKLYALDNKDDDVEKKLKMFEKITKKYIVNLVIDNNKQVLKAFHKLGIDTLKFKTGEKLIPRK